MSHSLIMRQIESLMAVQFLERTEDARIAHLSYYTVENLAMLSEHETSERVLDAIKSTIESRR